MLTLVAVLGAAPAFGPGAAVNAQGSSPTPTTAAPTEAPTSAPTDTLSSAVVPQAPADQPLPTDQIIIKYKAGSLARSLPMQAQQNQRLSAAAGTALEFLRPMSGDANVLRLPEKLPAEQVQAIAAQLMTLPDVEYAEPDQILLPVFTPNDPQYGSQWDLSGTWGINAPAAWDITTGSSSIVVADIDTGITNHVEFGGRTVPGYDFISDVPTANDGNGRDADPSDPGDWITSDENTSGQFAGCGVANSSWHGTHTAGTIGASGNNSIGVAGINWNSKILPVRVLGKCGGTTSDVVDGMRWAAGLPVSGVPNNANPGRVLNMSLGGSGGGPGFSCSSTIQTAVTDVTSAGAVVVAAAGNDNVNASGFEPANCSGVVTVAATNKNGSKAYYSNYGSTVEISAPGGAQSFNNDPNGILSTLNTGATSPASDTYIYYQGTSMATPHVTGVVSLMLSVSPSLTPAQVLAILQSTARAFPGGSTCNTSICGSGIVDAGAAVAASGPQGITVGTYRGNVFSLRNSNSAGAPDLVFSYGIPGDIPVVGDWDGNGTTTVGVYRGNVFYLRNSNSSGWADLEFPYGIPGDLPVVGDWNGDLTTTVGVYRGNVFYLRDSNSSGYADLAFAYGIAGDIPVLGDWNGDGTTTVGVYRGNIFYLRNSNSSGYADLAFGYGMSGDVPVLGDWNGDLTTTVGVFRNGLFYLRNSNSSGYADLAFGYGISSDKPLTGNWDGLP